MKTAVFVCLFGSAFCQPWGSLVHDTPEVAAAKAHHLATLAKAHQEAQQQLWNAQDRSGIEDDGSYKEQEENEGSWKEEDGSWKGDDRSWSPQSPSWTLQPQQWSQPQVHQAAHGHWQGAEKKWTGPVALPPGFDKNGAPLQVLDTPEVAAEKAKHFQLYTHSAYAAAAAAHVAPAQNAPSWH